MRNRAENQVTLVLIRHGATESNREHRYLGRTDESLSGEGRAGLLKRRNGNCYPDVDVLFTSPMKRCMSTAEILYPYRDPIVIPEWVEMDFGAFEGKNYAELNGDKQYQAWIDSNGTLPFPEGESREEFLMRCETGFNRMLETLAKMAACGKAPETVGMVVHGGTIMSILSKYCGGDYFDYQVSNGDGYVCILRDGNDSPEITNLCKLRVYRDRGEV